MTDATTATATASTSTSTSTSTATLTTPWIMHPVVDFAIGAGLLSLPLMVLTEWVSTQVEHGASLALVAAAVLALVVNGPHYAATIVRAWSLSATARRVLWVASVAAVVVGVIAHVAPAVLPFVFAAYLSWSPWHYATQNHGVTLALFGRLAPQAAPTAGERRALKTLHVLLALGAVVNLHAGPAEPLLYRVGVDASLARGVDVAVAVVAVVGALALTLRLRRRGAPVRALVWLLALLSTSFVWFAVPALFGAVGAIVYASGAAALLHCAQYLWLSQFVAGRMAFLRKQRFDIVAYAALVLALGVALFTLVPWTLSKLGGYDLVMSLLALQAVVNSTTSSSTPSSGSCAIPTCAPPSTATSAPPRSAPRSRTPAPSPCRCRWCSCCSWASSTSSSSRAPAPMHQRSSRCAPWS